MLSPDELARASAEHGVEERVLAADWLTSQVLQALAEELRAARALLYGGQALHRTWISGRFSEGIDVQAEDPGALAVRFAEVVRTALVDLPGLAVERHVDGRGHHWVMVETEAAATSVQIVAMEPPLRRPSAVDAPVSLRWGHPAATVVLRVPTPQAAFALKVGSWRDRRSLRDLYDLDLLVAAGALDEDAREETRRITGAAPTEHDFPPFARLELVRSRWHAELAGMVAAPGDPDEARQRLVAALRALGEHAG